MGTWNGLGSMCRVKHTVRVGDSVSSKLKRLKQEMILVYGTRCWISSLEDNRLTGHHIIPVRDNGHTEWENIALLSAISHNYFNYIERINPKVAKELNDLFYELNRTYAPPTIEYFDEVEYVLKKVRL